jgi:HJR/Mrr/RecB family endonuclease
MQGAVLRELRSARPETWEMDLGISFLDLVMADGLELVSADSQSFVLEYLSQAFEYAHRPDLDDYEGPGFVREALRRINALRKLYDSRELPSHLIQVVSSINTDLIRSIKAIPSVIHKLEWRVFEALIAELLSAYGWKIELTRASKDNGYDIFGIYSDRSGVDHAWLIECKKYSPDRPVGVEIVRSLYGVKTDLRVGNAMLATTSCFTKGAKAFKASRWDFELKDFEAILAWINEYRPNPEGQLHIRDHRLVLPG